SEHVGDRDVGSGELFDIAFLTREPGDRQPIVFGGHARAAGRAERSQRIVVNLAPGHDRNLLVEQVDQTSQDAALRLAAETEQDEIVPRKDGVDELRYDRFVVSDDAGEQPLAGLKLSNEVVSDLFLDRAHAGTRVLPQVAEGLNWGRHESILLH